MNRAGLALKIVIVQDDDAAFVSRHQLARLEAECPGDTKRANALAAPFAAMRMGTIFYQGNFVASCDFLKTIEIRRVPAHVNRNNCLGVCGVMAASASCGRCSRFRHPRPPAPEARLLVTATPCLAPWKRANLPSNSRVLVP
jgi:hypothetical protein